MRDGSMGTLGRLGACFGVAQVGWGEGLTADRHTDTQTGIKCELHEKNHLIGISWPSLDHKVFITV